MLADLRPDVHAALVGDSLVLLDLAQDAYLCLPDATRLVRDEAGTPAFAAGPVGSALAGAGLLTTRPRAARPTPPPKPVRTVIYDQPARPAGLGDWAAALAAVAEMRRLAPGLGVAAYLQDGVAKGSDRTPERVAEAARTFWRMAPWLPIEGECLVRSAVLMRFLRRRGLAADWVFGVRLWPFMAHCWVQIGDLCLNDDVERLVAYTPIYHR